MDEIDISRLIKENNWDIMKINDAIMIPLIQNSECKKENKVEALKVQDLLNKYIKSFQSYQCQLGVEEIICIYMVDYLKFHQKVADSSFKYSVIPVLAIDFEEGDRQILDQKVKQQGQRLEELLKQAKLSSNKENDETEQHAIMLVMAYGYFQQEKFNQANTFLDKLQEVLNLENNITQQQEKIKYQFIESIVTFQALISIYQNDLQNLQDQIQNLLKLNEYINRNQTKIHIILFQAHQYFMEEEFEKANQALETLNNIEIEQSLLIFFHNTNKQCLRNMETIYLNLFGGKYFELFVLLQEYFRFGKRNKNNNSYQYTSSSSNDDKYRYGGGNLLLLFVIYSLLLRQGEKYEQSIEQMKLMFQISEQEQTKFSQPLQLYFMYHLLLPMLYLEIQKPDEVKSKEFVIKENLNKANKLNEINVVEKNNKLYIQKLLKIDHEKPEQKFKFLNEVALQMLISHRYIQKVYEVYQNQEEKIVQIQKKQGQNLSDLFRLKKVYQKRRLGYILQILQAVEYLRSQNIIHFDLKLENIVVWSDNPCQIKIIDFGASQLSLFNKYFKNDEFTRIYASLEQKDKKLCTFESDVYSIAIIMEKTLLIKQENDLIGEEMDEFLISKQMIDLINFMKIEQKRRPTIVTVIQKFNLDLFIFRIFKQIAKVNKQNLSDKKQNLEDKKEQYQEFVNQMIRVFDKFNSYHYKTAILKEENNKGELEQLFKDEGIQILDIYKAIFQLRRYTLFLECLKNVDIKFFVEKIFSSVNKDSEFKSFVVNLAKLNTQQQKEDKIEVIDQKYIEFLKGSKQKTKDNDLEDQFKKKQKEIDSQVMEYLKKLDCQQITQQNNQQNNTQDQNLPQSLYSENTYAKSSNKDQQTIEQKSNRMTTTEQNYIFQYNQIGEITEKEQQSNESEDKQDSELSDQNNSQHQNYTDNMNINYEIYRNQQQESSTSTIRQIF